MLLSATGAYELIWINSHSMKLFFFLQLTIAVYDSQIDSMQTYGNLTVSMQRNFNGPIFKERPYRRSLDWRDAVGKVVVKLVADDADGVCCF